VAAQVHADVGLKDSLILRRYTALPQFLDLLHSRSLYLSRADGFPDRLEGALFPTLRKSLDDAHSRGESSENADLFYMKARMGSYVSCWTLGAKDNMALWQLYGDAKTNLVLTTTFGRLVRLALSWPESRSYIAFSTLTIATCRLTSSGGTRMYCSTRTTPSRTRANSASFTLDLGKAGSGIQWAFAFQSQISMVSSEV
jgi:hypothetical protein